VIPSGHSKVNLFVLDEHLNSLRTQLHNTDNKAGPALIGHGLRILGLVVIIGVSSASHFAPTLSSALSGNARNECRRNADSGLSQSNTLTRENCPDHLFIVMAIENYACNVIFLS